MTSLEKAHNTVLQPISPFSSQPSSQTGLDSPGQRERRQLLVFQRMTALRLRGRMQRSEQRGRERDRLEIQHDRTRPTLRRLVVLKHKAAAIFFKVGRNTTSTSSSFIEKGTEGAPNLLWPRRMKPFAMTSTLAISPRAKSVGHGAIPNF